MATFFADIPESGIIAPEAFVCGLLHDMGKIALDAISFHEVGKDAFGKPLEHVVTKRLYPSPGEQQ